METKKMATGHEMHKRVDNHQMIITAKYGSYH